jgi:serine phosphatase RsbU (regulator of sigma subunit)
MKSKFSKISSKISISAYINLTVITFVLLTGIVGIHYAKTVLYENKLRDTRTILFYEIERQAERIVSFAEDVSNLPKNGMISVNQEYKIKKINGSLDLNSLKKSSKNLFRSKDRFVYWQSGPDVVIFKNTKKRRIAKSTANFDYWKVPNPTFNKVFKESLVRGQRAYAVTKSGNLFFSSHRSISSANVLNRAVVKNFILDPFTNGQIEFLFGEDKWFAFYKELPGTNLIFFVESPQQIVIGPIQKTIFKMWIVLLLTLSAALVLIQYPLLIVSNPLKKLIYFTRQISQGNLKMTASDSGFGEIKILNETFGQMSENLVSRDIKIKELFKEKTEKDRLKREADCAGFVQKYFLPNDEVQSDIDLDISVKYSPADTVAGDWFTFYDLPNKNVTIFAIVDISGHGLGSAMMTGVIKGIFDVAKINEETDLEVIASRINTSLFSMRESGMHATAVFAKIDKSSGKVDLTGMGHCPSFHIKSHEPFEAKAIALRSNVLGNEENIQPKSKTITLEQGQSLVLYTDALIEQGKRPATSRSIFKALAKSSLSDSNSILQSLHTSYIKNLNGKPSDDDLCLIVVKRR